MQCNVLRINAKTSRIPFCECEFWLGYNSKILRSENNERTIYNITEQNMLRGKILATIDLPEVLDDKLVTSGISTSPIQPKRKL